MNLSPRMTGYGWAKHSRSWTVEAARRQLILFTCREDLLDLAGRHGAHIIRLPE